MSVCPECGQIDNDLCQCAVCDSDCFSVAGDGAAETPLVVTPKLDPDNENLLSCAGDGLLARLPDYITNPPRCQAYNSADISIPDSSATPLTFNSERFDTDSMHTGSSSQIMIQTAGVYIVTFQVEWDDNVEGDREGFIRKNGADFIAKSSYHAVSDSGVGTTSSICIQELFEVGEYVEALVKQDSGVSLDVVANRGSPIFAAQFRRLPPED